MSYAEPRTALRPLLPSGPGGLGCCHPDPSWALILSKDRALWPFFNHVVCVLRVETFFFFLRSGFISTRKIQFRYNFSYKLWRADPTQVTTELMVATDEQTNRGATRYQRERGSKPETWTPTQWGKCARREDHRLVKRKENHFGNQLKQLQKTCLPPCAGLGQCDGRQGAGGPGALGMSRPPWESVTVHKGMLTIKCVH